MSRDLDGLLEQLVPGAGHRSLSDADAPAFPAGLDLRPLEVLARGSTGWVFQAHDPVLDRLVAVKISRPDAGAPARDSVLAEARITARLAHPVVLPVHRIQVVDGHLCVVYALGPPTTLAHCLASWRRDPERAWDADRRLACLHRIAAGMAHAHSLGVVHGDLSPVNVAVDDEANPYVLDWSGLVAAEGAFSGTPELAAPEQLAGQPPTEASDVYALAALAWELLADRALRPVTLPDTASAAERVAAHARAPGPTAPPPGIEEDLGRALLAAADPDPAHRPTVAALAESIADARSGRAQAARRRAEAEAELAAARRELLAFHERERRLQDERHVIAVGQARIPPHAEAAAKRELWASQVRAEDMLRDQALAWTEAVEHALAAAHLEPDLDEAHAMIAELWFDRMRMAEDNDYVAEDELALSRVRRHDRGRFAELLGGEARLSVAGDGQVALLRVVSDGLQLTESLHTTCPLPIDRLALAPGSWVLVVRSPGRPEIRVPVAVQRLEHLSLDPRPPASIRDGFCFVAGGPFHMGGDRKAHQALEHCVPWVEPLWVARHPVTSEAYLAFLRDLPLDKAVERAPAQRLVTGRTVALWGVGGGGISLPAGWDPRWPVVGIRLDDAHAFAAWRAAEVGLALRLPSEEEWEKAARGADGRAYPWGATFDPAWCHMRDSLAGTPRLLDVGHFDTDRSPYGVCDVAGGVHEWTTSLLAGDRHVLRGGSWASDEQACRLASRSGAPADARSPTVGFRLVARAE